MVFPDPFFPIKPKIDPFFRSQVNPEQDLLLAKAFSKFLISNIDDSLLYNNVW